MKELLELEGWSRRLLSSRDVRVQPAALLHWLITAEFWLTTLKAPNSQASQLASLSRCLEVGCMLCSDALGIQFTI